MRAANRLASLLLAVILLAGGSILTLESVLLAIGRPALLIDREDWYTALTTVRVDSLGVRRTAMALFGVGSLILFAELRRWAPERLRLPGLPGWHLRRRCVERRLTTVARAVPGVRKARARVRPEGEGWRSQLRVVGDPAASSSVRRAVDRELYRLTPRSHVTVEVTFVCPRRIR